MTRSLSKLLPITTKPQRGGSAQMASLKNRDCTLHRLSGSKAAPGLGKSSFPISAQPRQLGQSKQTPQRKMQDPPLLPFTLCKRQYFVPAAHTPDQSRAAKAKPGLGSNPGKGILARWAQTRLQTQPSSTRGQCFESSASKRCFTPALSVSGNQTTTQAEGQVSIFRAI